MNNPVVLIGIAADNLTRFYWANVYKENVQCPTLETFAKAVYNKTLQVEEGSPNETKPSDTERRQDSAEVPTSKPDDAA